MSLEEVRPPEYREECHHTRLAQGNLVSTIGAGARHDLSDSQWWILQPLLPPPSGRGRPRRWPLPG